MWGSGPARVHRDRRRRQRCPRHTGDSILLTGRTRELLTGSQVPLVERVGVALKGKRETVRLYAPE